MVISAPEAPSSELLELLRDLNRCAPVPWEKRRGRELIPEAERWGLPVSLDPDQGHWHLHHPEQTWNSERLAAAWGILPCETQVWPFCDSSNLQLLANPQWHLGIAEAQWAGRGRRGRTWHSPYGRHVYLSVSVTPPASTPGTLPLVAALGVFQVLMTEIPDLWVKWPNDLWAGRKKLGGVLMEGRRQGDQQRWVLGLGINVLEDGTLPDNAACLAGLGMIWTRQELAESVLRQWRADFTLLEGSGFGQFADLWNAADGLSGKPATICQEGEERQILALGVASDGRLLIQEGHHTRLVSAGDIHIRPIP